MGLGVRRPRLREATLEEVRQYGQPGLAKRGLLPPRDRYGQLPMAGGVGIYQVGADSNGGTGLSFSTTQQNITFAASCPLTVGHLLVCWGDCTGTATVPTVSTLSGTATWHTSSVVDSTNAMSAFVSIAVATGNDQVGVQAATGGSGFASVAEFAGWTQPATASAQNAIDHQATAQGTSSPVTATLPAKDFAPAELILFSTVALYSTSASRSLTPSCNNGATAVTDGFINSGATVYPLFGHGVTTSNAVADTVSITPSTTSKLTNLIVVAISILTAGPLFHLDFPQPLLP